MINEQLGSALSGTNIKNKTQEYAFNEVGKGNIDTPTNAILGTMDMTKDLGEDENKEQIIRKPLKKGITSNLIGKTKMKKPIGLLFSITKEEIENIKNESKINLEEKWSQTYKDSIDCKHPKGFSQRAHCQGKKKKSEAKEATGAGSAGGFVGPVGFNPNSEFVKKSFKETPKKVEAKEATGAGSSGSYETTAAWAKSMNKKDWRGKSKTQIPGGQFVQVKKKCKKFPYCNQGDIKALKLSEDKEILKQIIKSVSEKYNISEGLVVDILKTEYPKTNKAK